MSFLRRLFDPGRDARREAERARTEEEARQGRIREGTAALDSTFKQFDDSFFDRIRQSYTDFARPQVDEQFGKARDSLTFDLARTGMLDSSSRVNRSGDLTSLYNRENLNIADTARTFETQTRGNVENARADVLGMLNATGDATAASNAAQSRAAIVSQPPAYSPVGQLFTDFTSGLSQQAALERSAALGSPIKPRVNTGLFGTPRNAVRVSG